MIISEAMMGKVVGIAAFKATCERLLVQMEADGEPIQLTRRGKVVAVLSPPPAAHAAVAADDPDGLYGMLRNDRYRFDAEPEEPGASLSEWDALR